MVESSSRKISEREKALLLVEAAIGPTTTKQWREQRRAQGLSPREELIVRQKHRWARNDQRHSH